MRKRFSTIIALLLLAPVMLLAANTTTRKHTHATDKLQETAKTTSTHHAIHSSTHATKAHSTTAKVTVHKSGSRAVARRIALTSSRSRHHKVYERFSGNSFAANDLSGDVTAGEDPVVRQAALDALGNMHGTVVAIDPSNGRILAMVNQKLALSGGAEPCSTIKVSVALAALQEGIIKADTPVNLGGHYHMNLTEALAHSNNLYFETLGRALGFEKVRHYATQFGLGELAGYNIDGEQLGTYPQAALPEKLGGVGRMCSFGEGVNMTPLQLGALVASIANGGTLYYLQHPKTPDEVLSLQPRVKRTLEINKFIPEISGGMQGAVQYGTARSLKVNFSEIPVLGKTGTCSNNGTRYGWFASYADTQYGRIVTVFFLEGGRATFGPKAAELTGHFYHNLWQGSYFAKAQEAAEKQAAVGVTN
jgi:membrane carboxypeptidase/penicillin-binding protein